MTSRAASLAAHRGPRAGRAGLAFILVAMLVLATAPRAETTPAGVTLLTQLADRGDPDAQYGLGTWYMENHASQSELEKGRDWLLQAARQQHVHAMFRLGVMLNRFDSLRDEGQSMTWVRSAAEAGLADAQATLGMYLFQGLADSRPDCEAAAHWLEKADAVGHETAESNLVWVLATCPVESQRDGSRALRLAFDQVYRRGMKTANQMDNLAAAYAAAGDFLSAEVAQREALAMEQDPDVRSVFQQHLDSYLARRAWVEHPARR